MAGWNFCSTYMTEQDKQIAVIKEYAPGEERMVRALLIALDFTPEEIERFFCEQPPDHLNAPAASP